MSSHKQGIYINPSNAQGTSLKKGRRNLKAKERNGSVKYLLPGMIELPIHVHVLIFFKKKEEKGIPLKCHLQIIHTVHRSHILLNENLAIKDRMTPISYWSWRLQSKPLSNTAITNSLRSHCYRHHIFCLQNTDKLGWN